MQLLPMASSPDGLISARYAVITKTPGWEVFTTTSDVNVTQGHGCYLTVPGGGSYFVGVVLHRWRILRPPRPPRTMDVLVPWQRCTPPFVIAMQKPHLNKVPTPTVAWTRP